MEDEVKVGVVNIQKGGLMKGWQKKWVALHKKSSHGVPRLEIYDSKDNFDKRLKGAKKHIIPLATCVNITKNVSHESKKPDFHLQMAFSDNEKPQVLSIESQDELIMWYNVISHVVFRGDEAMEVNSLYQSYVDEIYVVQIKENENAMKLNLKGKYNLIVTTEDLVLKKNNDTIVSWPLHLLRKYGRDKREFSFEAGRRCPSGPGMFYFITDRYNAIFQDVENKVKNLASRRRAQSNSSFHGANSKKSPTPSISSSLETTSTADTSFYADPIDVKKSKEKTEIEPVYNEPFQPTTRPQPKSKSVFPGLKSKPSPAKKKDKSSSKPKPITKEKPQQPPTSPVFDLENNENAYGHLSLESNPAAEAEGSYDSLQWNKATGNGTNNTNTNMSVPEDDYASAYDLTISPAPPGNNNAEGVYDQVKR